MSDLRDKIIHELISKGHMYNADELDESGLSVVIDVFEKALSDMRTEFQGKLGYDNEN